MDIIQNLKDFEAGPTKKSKNNFWSTKEIWAPPKTILVKTDLDAKVVSRPGALFTKLA